MTTSHGLSNKNLAIVREEYAIATKRAEESVKKGQVLDRLLANPDFQEFISKFYFEEEFHRVAMMLSISKDDKSATAHTNALRGIHQFREFLNTIATGKEMGERHLAQSEDQFISYYAENYQFPADDEEDAE